MSTIGERLTWAIQEHGPRAPRDQGRPGAKGSIRQFYEQGLKDRPDLKGKGASYQMLHRYLRDETAPPAEFMEAAADILKPVRRAWLETGEEPRTEAEARGRQAATDGDILEMLITQLATRTDDDRLADAFRGSRAGWLVNSQGVQARLIEVFTRWHAQNEYLHQLLGHDSPAPADSVRRFADLLAAPIMQWHTIRLGLNVHPERLLAYVDAALLALSLATPDGRDFNYLTTDTEPDNAES
jgi:hypothetical protein